MKEYWVEVGEKKGRGGKKSVESFERH